MDISQELFGMGIYSSDLILSVVLIWYSTFTALAEDLEKSGHGSIVLLSLVNRGHRLLSFEKFVGKFVFLDSVGGWGRV